MPTASEIKAHAEGWGSFGRSSLFENPYKAYTPEFYAWELGWQDHKQELISDFEVTQ